MGVVERDRGVVSVAWLHVMFSSVKKTSLFVKSPQEQNVPLLQECVTCARSPRVTVGVRVCVLAGAGLVAGWLVSAAFGLSLGSLAGELCYYRSSVTHRHDQKRIRIHGSLQTSPLI